MKLRALVDESDLIKSTVETKTSEERQKYDPDATASEWFARRVKNQRLKNRTVSNIWYSQL